MHDETLRHESSFLYQAALNAYRSAIGLGRTDSRVLNRAIRRNGLKCLEHCATASDAESPRQCAQSLRFAKQALLKWFATVDAIACEELASAKALATARAALTHLSREIDCRLRPELAETEAAEALDDRVLPPFPPFDPSRVIGDDLSLDQEAADSARECDPYRDPLPS
jgi:hypothetical protein